MFGVDDAAVMYGLGAAGNMASGIWGGQDAPEQRPTYSVPGIWDQGKLIKQMVNASRRGDGDFGFAPAAQAGNSTLQQLMRDRGFAGNVGEGAGGSLYAQMLASAMGQDAAGRRRFGLDASQATPWVMNYDLKGTSPYGANWNGPQTPARRPQRPGPGAGSNPDYAGGGSLSGGSSASFF